jgi:hypothetical protein
MADENRIGDDRNGRQKNPDCSDLLNYIFGTFSDTW